MDEQSVIKVWACYKRFPYRSFFITEAKEEVRGARKRGYKCRRLKSLEEARREEADSGSNG